MTRRAEQYAYQPRTPGLGEAALYPFLPLNLTFRQKAVSVMGLLDTAATINVLPDEVGLQLGAVWDELTTPLELAGNLARQEARALLISGKVGKFAPVPQVFAWAKSNSIPLLLGQTNFFMEFDVCFFRSRAVFEIRPKHAAQSGARKGR